MTWTGFRVLAAVVVLAVLVTAAVVLLAWPRTESFPFAPAPPQFDEQLDQALAAGNSDVVGVAHNAGNAHSTTEVALEHGADVVEVDVISVRGELVAGRDAPLSWLSDHLFRGPSLTSVWERAAEASVIKLDLKRNDASLLEQVVAFVAPRSTDRRVMVVTPSPEAVHFLRPRLPNALLLLSVPKPSVWARLQGDTALARAIDGVSLFHRLAEPARMSWLRSRQLMVLAWTVNDAERAGALIRLGVDGITTNNLAILRALDARATADR